LGPEMRLTSVDQELADLTAYQDSTTHLALNSQALRGQIKTKSQLQLYVT